MTANVRMAGMRGRVFFDGLCPVCSALRDRWDPVLAPLGYPFVPLQHPDAVRELGLVPGVVPDEIQLVMADGTRLKGFEALRRLAGQVWWLKPVAWLADLPGLRGVARAAYGWVARNRYCLGDACSPPHCRCRRRHAAFFETP